MEQFKTAANIIAIIAVLVVACAIGPAIYFAAAKVVAVGAGFITVLALSVTWIVEAVQERQPRRAKKYSR